MFALQCLACGLRNSLYSSGVLLREYAGTVHSFQGIAYQEHQFLLGEHGCHRHLLLYSQVMGAAAVLLLFVQKAA